MNWFTKSFVGSMSSEKKKQLAEEHDCCEHVSTDHNLMVSVSYENDSFGREGYCVCESCAQAQQEAEDNETVICGDCKAEKPKKDTISWKWYDFYAAQGDEPYCVCKACVSLPRHRQRVERDRRDYQEEFPDD